ncbi:bifunctional DNA primase/polymerase [Rhodopirellula sallentina]|uniref:Bifunctional DNA primase/polymerase n=1 Tax=Rhodopirellula sallentina SM41 TaxID=1263870 RepID=M5U174_9BACT|nr:bifunctional DNA primase/polymerase [Rhodopirellula sallentina]EMI55192.1 Bifunctional DNA primase/polymerase [Rhodopirellula sallentina SM41]
MYHTNNNIIEQAKKLSEKGYAVFPLHGVNDAGYCRCGNINCKDVGKHPDTANGLKDAVSDMPGINSLFEGKNKNNIGITTGKRSNIIVVDVDDVNKFSELEKNTNLLRRYRCRQAKDDTFTLGIVTIMQT